MKYLGKKYQNKANRNGVIVTAEHEDTVILGNGISMPISQFVKFYEEIDETKPVKSQLSKIERKYKIKLTGFPKEMWVWNTKESQKRKALVMFTNNGTHYAFDEFFGIIAYKNAKDI
jgi:ATP:corrinoid adenosyltransferase